MVERRSPLVPWPAALVTVIAGAAALLLFAGNLAVLLPPAAWTGALFDPGADNMAVLLARDSLLPRLVMACLCGGGLGLAGAILQQALRNPMAEPGTLAIFSGAKLMLALAATLVPSLGVLGQDGLAALGGGLSFAVVLFIGLHGRLSPLAVILAGLIVTLFTDALARTLVLFNHDALLDLFVWQSGILSQNSWQPVLALLPRLAVPALLILLLRRPLALLDLTDDGARNLGLSPAVLRVGALAIAFALAVFIAAAVGVIAFVGLIGPALARLLGARRLGQRLFWGTMLSAVLLALTDQAALTLAGDLPVPTGAVTALIGAPLLLWLLGRSRAPAPIAGGAGPSRRSAQRWPWLLTLVLLLGLIIWLGLALGRTPEGWLWADGALFDRLLPWRAPRLATAIAAGVMLALAGTILQRLTGNALASPDLLGISSGAALMVVIAALAVPGLGRPGALVAGGVGALISLLALLWLGRRSAFSSDHMLLAGVALATVTSAVLGVLMLGGDPRLATLLSWLAGSTYGLTGRDAVITGGLALGLALIVPLAGRWLTILPLGGAAARALGLPLAASRLGLLLIAAALTGAATLAVGPLSFVGLMAPHLARLAGFQRAGDQLLVAGLLGAVIMAAADWLGRQLAFPSQIPAGLVASLLGGGYFLLLMVANRRR